MLPRPAVLLLVGLSLALIVLSPAGITADDRQASVDKGEGDVDARGGLTLNPTLDQLVESLEEPPRWSHLPRNSALLSQSVEDPTRENKVVSSKEDRGRHPVEIITLSNRADLISGGDVLVEISLLGSAMPAALTVQAGDRDVTDAFAVRDNGRILGLVEDLPLGETELTASLNAKRQTQIILTNHPIGGPLVSGPQVRPWICTTEEAGLGPAQDEQCNAPPVYELFYLPEDGDELEPYDSEDPPSDVAQTTTDQGVTVPFIVRRERGVINRGIYDIAVLFDPDEVWEPWSPQPAWNGKLFWRFGGNCTPNHRQPTGVNVLLSRYALSQGFAIASSGLNVLGKNCNDVVSAEAVVMVKEHFIETYGPVRFTMSAGSSGGSMLQHWIVSNYPGVIDGIMPKASFPDVWATLQEAEDCFLLSRGLLASGIVRPAQIRAVTGHRNELVCGAVQRPWWDVYAKKWQDPTFHFSCQGGRSHAPESAQPAPWVYHPLINPTGTRCTLQDYQVALFGTRPAGVWTEPESDAGGFANRPFDNVGVQYGLAALNDGAINRNRFIELNENVGGYDIDWNPQLERSEADPAALVAAYRGGRVTYPREAATVPIIDIRDYDPCDLGGIHTCWYTYSMEARLQEAYGHSDNQIILFQPPGAYPFDLMNSWLSAIEADQSDDSLEARVVRNKPAEAVNACWTTGERETDWDRCQELNPHFSNPRLVAGAPLTNNVLKCQLKPLDPDDYTVEFTDDQWQRLHEVFPDGVCDYSRPGVSQEPSIPWLTYADGPGGRQLGEPPESTPRPPRE